MEFDYIVVGAGSAGCVLADKLTRDGATTVLVVESGGVDTSPLIDMPRGIGRLLQPGNRHVWAYEVSRGGNRGVDYWLKGRVLGGSSSINGLVYVRGHPADYDGWAAAGCQGWGWSDVSRVFVAMEDHDLGAGPDRGAGGPLKISVHPRSSGLAEAVLEAAESAGTPRVADVNLAYGGGFGYQPRNIWRGRRQSAAKVFLRPAMSRSNLTVLTETDALRLVFEGRRAIGVELRGPAGLSTARARREVILSAGAVQTPKLLQLSGVGPAAQLQSLGIEVVRDAPEVGLNLQEHFNLQVQFRVTRDSLNRELSGLRLMVNLARYFGFGAGPMTHAAHELCGFVKSRPGLSRPDVQLGVGLYSLTRTKKGLGVEAEPGMSIGGYFMQPESRGLLRIVSPDPDAAPFIDANYCGHPVDREGAVSMIRYIRKIADQPALREYVSAELSPGPSVVTDDDILAASLASGTTAFHVASTCRMGSDERSVVDPDLRVRGVDGLRVADTSIMPRVISGNTNAAAMMIGWRAAELIAAAQYQPNVLRSA